MLDATDQKLVEALLEDARMSLKALAQRVGMSAPSVAERLRRLEDRGVVRAYRVELDPEALGYTLQAIVRVRPAPGELHRVEELLVKIPEVVECDKVTGEDCYVVRLFVRSMAQLDQILDRIADKAQTSTAIVKAQTVRRRPPPLGFVTSRE
ncbi:Lrp/AsnC family transcriptional regulator [Hydrogenophaga sp.]|uniref:Lrp/AsnC family transcriptional regulator n=1 Tax=Hydrogenophaga sp. TaxID=1904254 RepID=UPI00356320D2